MANIQIPNQVIKEYIVILKDESLKLFFDEINLRSIGFKTNCKIKLTNRILNRKLNSFRTVKYAIITVTGPDECSIRQCNRLIEHNFPLYRHRKDYQKRSECCTIYPHEFVPDNTSLIFQYQRTGSTSYQYGDVLLKSPYDTNNIRTLKVCRWKSGHFDLQKSINITHQRQTEVYMNCKKHHMTEPEPLYKGIISTFCGREKNKMGNEKLKFTRDDCSVNDFNIKYSDYPAKRVQFYDSSFRICMSDDSDKISDQALRILENKIILSLENSLLSYLINEHLKEDESDDFTESIDTNFNTQYAQDNKMINGFYEPLIDNIIDDQLLAMTKKIDQSNRSTDVDGKEMVNLKSVDDLSDQSSNLVLTNSTNEEAMHMESTNIYLTDQSSGVVAPRKNSKSTFSMTSIDNLIEYELLSDAIRQLELQYEDKFLEKEINKDIKRRNSNSANELYVEIENDIFADALEQVVMEYQQKLDERHNNESKESLVKISDIVEDGIYEEAVDQMIFSVKENIEINDKALDCVNKIAVIEENWIYYDALNKLAETYQIMLEKKQGEKEKEGNQGLVPSQGIVNNEKDITDIPTLDILEKENEEKIMDMISIPLMQIMSNEVDKIYDDALDIIAFDYVDKLYKKESEITTENRTLNSADQVAENVEKEIYSKALEKLISEYCGVAVDSLESKTSSSDDKRPSITFRKKINKTAPASEKGEVEEKKEKSGEKKNDRNKKNVKDVIVGELNKQLTDERGYGHKRIKDILYQTTGVKDELVIDTSEDKAENNKSNNVSYWQQSDEEEPFELDDNDRVVVVDTVNNTSADINLENGSNYTMNQDSCKTVFMGYCEDDIIMTDYYTDFINTEPLRSLVDRILPSIPKEEWATLCFGLENIKLFAGSIALEIYSHKDMLSVCWEPNIFGDCCTVSTEMLGELNFILLPYSNADIVMKYAITAYLRERDHINYNFMINVCKDKEGMSFKEEKQKDMEFTKTIRRNCSHRSQDSLDSFISSINLDSSMNKNKLDFAQPKTKNLLNKPIIKQTLLDISKKAQLKKTEKIQISTKLLTPESDCGIDTLLSSNSVYDSKNITYNYRPKNVLTYNTTNDYYCYSGSPDRQASKLKSCPNRSRSFSDRLKYTARQFFGKLKGTEKKSDDRTSVELRSPTDESILNSELDDQLEETSEFADLSSLDSCLSKNTLTKYLNIRRFDSLKLFKLKRRTLLTKCHNAYSND